MKEEKNNTTDEHGPLDDLFREGLTGHRVQPPATVWKGIGRKLLFREIIRLNFSNLSSGAWVSGAALITVISGAVLYVYLNGDPKKEMVSVSRPDPAVMSSGGERMTGVAIPEQKMSSVRKSGSDAPVPFTVKSSPAASGPATPVSGKPSPHPEHPVAEVPASLPVNRVPASIEIDAGNVPGHNADAASEKRAAGILSAIDPHTLYETELAAGFSAPGPVANPPYEELKVAGYFQLEGPSRHFSFGIHAAPDISFYDAGEPYSKIGYWGGVDFNYHIGSFYVGPGIRIGVMNDRGAYDIHYKSRDSIGYFYRVVSYTLNGGQVIFHTETQTVFDSLPHNAGYYSSDRYTYLQVPLTLGVRVARTDHFQFSFEATPVFSLLLSSRWETDNPGIPVSARTLSETRLTPARMDIHWQVWAGLNFEYLLTENWSLYAKPYYSFYLTRLAKTGEMPYSNPQTAGLTIGLRYGFGFKNEEK